MAGRKVNEYYALVQNLNDNGYYCLSVHDPFECDSPKIKCPDCIIEDGVTVMTDSCTSKANYYVAKAGGLIVDGVLIRRSTTRVKKKNDIFW